MKRILLFATFIISLNLVYTQTKTIKVLLDDGTTRYYPLGTVTKFTFEDDACDGVSTVSHSGKTYTTIQLGSQCWLKENLNIGTMINSTTGGTDSDGEQTDNSTLEKYCYDNIESNCSIYGGLYQWNEAMQYVTTEVAQGICPSGWHIPTTTELQACDTNAGDSGNALKAIGQGSGSGAGTNTSGFSGLLAGQRISNGTFNYLTTNTQLWSSTEDSNKAFTLGKGGSNDFVYHYSYDKSYGFSIRCIKN